MGQAVGVENDLAGKIDILVKNTDGGRVQLDPEFLEVRSAQAHDILGVLVFFLTRMGIFFLSRMGIFFLTRMGIFFLTRMGIFFLAGMGIFFLAGMGIFFLAGILVSDLIAFLLFWMFFLALTVMIIDCPGLNLSRSRPPGRRSKSQRRKHQHCQNYRFGFHRITSIGCIG
jgi:hypothetical protein